MYFTDQNLLESGDHMELKCYIFEMQKRNISANSAQRVDGKSGVIRLVMFTLRVMVIRMSKTGYFLYFLLNVAKYQSHFGQDI